MISIRSIKIHVFVILLSVVFFCIMFSILNISYHFLTSQSQKGHEGNERVQEYRNYKYLERNHESQSSKYGIVSLTRLIPKNEFLSYGDDIGNTIMISNFGDEEYECIGTCHCQDFEDFNRRTSIPLISRTISYLLVSVSSLAAINQAQKYFETKCQDELSQECSLSSSVKSSVISCSSINEETEESTNTNQGNKEDRRIYSCFGNCVPNLRTTKLQSEQESESDKNMDDFDCGQLRKEGEVIILEKDFKLSSISRTTTIKAISKFQKQYLTHYCKQKSKFKYIWKGKRKPNPKTGKMYPIKLNLTGSRCVGRSKYQDGNQNKNARCRQIHPVPKNNARKLQIQQFKKRKKEWDNGISL